MMRNQRDQSNFSYCLDDLLGHAHCTAKHLFGKENKTIIEPHILEGGPNDQLEPHINSVPGSVVVTKKK